jgi:hypothetical protein
LLLCGLVYAIYRFKQLDVEARKKWSKKLILVMFAVILLALAATGRLHWLAVAIGALLPLVPRAIRLVMGLWPALSPYFRRYQQNKQSSMQTRFLSLQINLLSGELQGEVLEGGYRGEKLQSMTIVQLCELLQECQQQDRESAALLIAYMQRMHPDWKPDTEKGSHYTADTSAMSEQQARDVLGVSESATKPEIIKAHKRLMQKLHPDRGGSDYLAVQINKAKEVLLKLL